MCAYKCMRVWVRCAWSFWFSLALTGRWASLRQANQSFCFPKQGLKLSLDKNNPTKTTSTHTRAHHSTARTARTHTQRAPQRAWRTRGRRQGGRDAERGGACDAAPLNATGVTDSTTHGPATNDGTYDTKGDAAALHGLPLTSEATMGTATALQDKLDELAVYTLALERTLLGVKRELRR